MPEYRALISVLIDASDDNAAFEQGGSYANSLTWPDSFCIAGHLEVLYEVGSGRVLWNELSDSDVPTECPSGEATADA